MFNSSATETTINNPVAENAPPSSNGASFTALEKPDDNALNKNVGINAITARKNAPNNVILFEIRFKKSLVGLPALIPGINPPY